jgi:peptide/nickel transport system substrate-binding protein
MKPMKPMSRLALAFFALLLALPAAAETVLRFVPQADLRILDTAWTTAAITRNHGYLIYEPLFSYDSKNVPRPQAVEDYTTSADGLTWTFNLREGMRFHDGTLVTAADAVASLDRWSKRKASGSTMRARVASIAAKDERSFEIVFKERFGLVLETLADAIQPTFILRAKDSAADPFTQIQFQEVVGSGPFQFVREEFVPGAKAVYRKAANYKPRAETADGFWGAKQAKVDRIEWLYLPDPNTQVQALIRGEVDILEMPPVDLVPLLARSPNIRVEVLDPMGSQAFFWLNTKHTPFDKPEVRRAVALLVDQNIFLSAVIGDPRYQRPCFSVMACGSPNETDAGSSEFRTANLAKAKELLRQAGYAGEPVVLLDPTDQHVLHAMSGMMANLMREAGFVVDLQANDWGTVVNRAARGDKPGPASPGWHMHPTWAPGRVVASPLTATQLRAPCNLTTFVPNPCDEKLEAFKTQFFAASSAEARRAAMDALQTRFYELMPYVVVGQFLAPKAWRDTIGGIVNASEFVFWNVEKR